MLKISQAAKRLGLSESSVRKLCDEGKLHAFRPMGPSGHRRISEESIDRFLGSLQPPAVERLVIPDSVYMEDDLGKILRRAKSIG
jgi:excisionase family DNA binding protein